MSEITRILEQASAGNREAIDQIVPLVARELHSLAQRHLSGERPDHTLQPTALVNEAYLRLVGEQPIRFRDRNHFLAVASKKMREILINHANRRNAKKRDGQLERRTLDASKLLAPDSALSLLDLLALDEALRRLEARADARSQRMAKVVEMRLFGGMGTKEIADLVDLTPRSVERELAAAVMLLLTDLEQ